MPKPIFPEKLKQGDKIVVIAPSDSLGCIASEVELIASERFVQMGFQVSFARHARELDEFDSSSIESRVADIHEAFLDTNVKGIIAAFGGFNSNQLLCSIDWDIIRNNPKVFIGFSDITALQNAIFAKTGLVTYSGPLYSTFGQKLYFDYTLEYFKKCVCNENEFDIVPSELWSNDGWLAEQEKRQLHKNEGWWVINEGVAEGTIIGGNICTFNLLQGTEYLPDISNSILFIEDDRESKLVHFTRDLQSIMHLPNFPKVKGIVIGRFENPSEVTREHLIKTIKTKKKLLHIPVLANMDFGHTEPMITFPIGGEVRLEASSVHPVLKIIRK